MLALVPQPYQPGGPRIHVAANSVETAYWAGGEVGKDRARVREIMAPSIRNQVELAEMLLQAAMLSSTPSQFGGMTKLLEHLKSLDFDSVDQTMGLMGDVEHCRAGLHEIVAALWPGRIITWFDFGGCVSHAQVLDSMELFSEAILPEWRARSA
jgi:hypothetical protein